MDLPWRDVVMLEGCCNAEKTRLYYSSKKGDGDYIRLIHWWANVSFFEMQ